jgi:hypothetical protein
MPAEFEEVLNNDPLDLDYELINNEERYRSVGLTIGAAYCRWCLLCALAGYAP